MTGQGIVPLVAAVAILAVSVVVHRNKGRTEAGKIFSLLATALVLWNFNFFVLYSVSDRDLVFRLTRLFRVGSIFLAPAILHLTFALQPQRPASWRWGLWGAYLAACILTVANALDLMVVGLQHYAGATTGFAGHSTACLRSSWLQIFWLHLLCFFTIVGPRQSPARGSSSGFGCSVR